VVLEPCRVALYDLAQRATLETREAKHEPRSLTEQRRVWAAQAEDVLGRGGTARMVARTLGHRPLPARVIDEARLKALATSVVHDPANIADRFFTYARYS